MRSCTALICGRCLASLGDLFFFEDVDLDDAYGLSDIVNLGASPMQTAMAKANIRPEESAGKERLQGVSPAQRTRRPQAQPEPPGSSGPGHRPESASQCLDLMFDCRISKNRSIMCNSREARCTGTAQCRLCTAPGVLVPKIIHQAISGFGCGLALVSRLATPCIGVAPHAFEPALTTQAQCIGSE